MQPTIIHSPLIEKCVQTVVVIGVLSVGALVNAAIYSEDSDKLHFFLATVVAMLGTIMSRHLHLSLNPVYRCVLLREKMGCEDADGGPFKPLLRAQAWLELPSYISMCYIGFWAMSAYQQRGFVSPLWGCGSLLLSIFLFSCYRGLRKRNIERTKQFIQIMTAPSTTFQTSETSEEE